MRRGKEHPIGAIKRLPILASAVNLALRLKNTARENDHTRFILEHLSSLVAEVDKKGLIRYASLSHKPILGYDPAQLVGRSIAEFVHPEDLPALDEKFGERSTADPASINQFRFRHANGSWRWIESSATPYAREERWSATFFIGMDITRRKTIEAAQTFLAQRGWARKGEDFFKALVRFLAESLGMDYVRVDRISEKGREARMIESFPAEGVEGHEIYALAGTPAAALVGQAEFVCFPEGVGALFPSDARLRDLGAEGYAAARLLSSEGAILGLIALASRRRLEDPSLTCEILRIVAMRACGELQRREGLEALERAIAQKEILMKELQHRVKNNLNIISSLLSLESHSIKDEASRGVFIDAQARIGSLSAIYERLYLSEDLAHVSIDNYIRDLAASLFSIYKVDSTRIRLRSCLQSLSMGTKRAVPLGLITNELITNAIKYAFPEGRQGEVFIGLEVAEGQARLTVSDDGVGFTTEARSDTRVGMGLGLVRSLATQLGARLSIDGESSGGARVSIEFEP